MQVTNFAEIEAEFLQRVHTMIWCNVATIDTNNRPRSRILHPIWEGNVGWIYTHRDSHKARHLEHSPYLSLAYIGNVMQPVYIDCKAEWWTNMDDKRRIWDLFKTTPEPLGYDPAHDFKHVEHENAGLLRLTPWRIDLVTFPAPSFAEGTKVWKQEV